MDRASLSTGRPDPLDFRAVVVNHRCMHASHRPGRELRTLAAEQADLITTRQAGALGFGEDAIERMIRDGHWTRRSSGLFDTAPRHDGFAKDVWAASLQAGEPYAIGGEAALRLHGLDRSVDRIDVWVPFERQPSSVGRTRVHRDRLGRVERGRGTPVRIRPEDALVDVGQRLPTEALVGVLSDAVRLRITTLERIRETLDQRHRVRLRARFADIVGDLSGIESTLEYVYRRDVERAHGLPTAVRQESLSAGSRSDALYEEYGVLVEVDGRLGHEDANSAFRDLHRDNAHATRDLITLRYGSADLRGRPCVAARQLWSVLHARGRPEPFQECPRCHP